MNFVAGVAQEVHAAWVVGLAAGLDIMHVLLSHFLPWWFTSYVTAGVVAAALAPLVIRIARSIGAIDVPDARKVHVRTMPRNGGLAIAGGAVGGALLATAAALAGGVFSSTTLSPWGAVLGVCGIGLLVLMVGLTDDVRGIPSFYKLLTLIAAAAAAQACGLHLQAIRLGGGLVVPAGAAAVAVATLWIVAVTVGINFIDGLDGLAGGVSAIAALAIAVAAARAGEVTAALLSLALAGGLTGFLFFNFRPARLFMGDCGSMFVGFMLANCSVLACLVPHGGGAGAGAAGRHGFTLLLPAAVLAVPLLDAAWTVLRRGLLQRRSIFSAERGHIHHRLLDAGLSHTRATLVLMGVTAVVASLAVALVGESPASTALGLSLVAIVVGVLFVRGGSVDVGEVAAAIGRNRTLGGQRRQTRRAFETAQLRFRNVQTFDQWWTELCNAAEAMAFSQVRLPLTGRDGTPSIRSWSDSSGSPGEMMSSVLPIPQRRSGGALMAEVELSTTPSLEAAGQRLALFSRLLDEHGLAKLPGVGETAPPAAVADAAGTADAADVTESASGAEETGSETSEDDAFTVPADSHTAALRVAIVHDFLYCYGGAERVLEEILRVYPDADLFSLFDFLPKGERAFIMDKPVRTSFLQRMPLARRNHRIYLPLMPLAIEQLDVSQYDLVISSSYCAAKGVLTRPGQLHVCYCHSPVRFAWDLQHQYLSAAGLASGVKSFFVRALLQYVRSWDTRSANNVDLFLTNSRFVSRRVDKFYRRRSTALYPPVAVDRFTASTQKDSYYVTASRLVPYKRVDLIVEAFNQSPHRRLIVVGDGPEFEKLKTKAGPNVQMMGQQSFVRLRNYLQGARAFIFAAEEDFGIAPVEAQACGTPVIAFGRGGATESIIPGRTGLFFDEQTPESLLAALERFEAVASWDVAAIRRNAERFSAARFREEFYRVVEAQWVSFRTAAQANKSADVSGSIVAGGLPGKLDSLSMLSHRHDPTWAPDAPINEVNGTKPDDAWTKPGAVA